MLLHIRLNREAMLMRTRSLIAVGFTLAVGGVNAQALDEPSLERQLAIDPVGPSGARRSPPPVVVDINSLPRARQEEIRRGVAERGEDELHNLRTAIDADPSIVIALQTKNLSSIHVLAAEVGRYGRLTLLIIKK